VAGVENVKAMHGVGRVMGAARGMVEVSEEGDDGVAEGHTV
jgi:hypothetical protein